MNGSSPGYSESSYPDPLLLEQVASALLGMRVAVAHEWVSANLAGSERVFQAIARLLGAVPHDQLVLFDERSRGERDPGPTTSSFLGRMGLYKAPKSLQLPLMPAAWATIGCGRYDLGIISSHAVATTFARRSTRSLVYSHTPARYVWAPELDPRGVGALGAPVRWALKALDASSATRVSAFVCNSNEVANRVRSYYDLPSLVIAPPIDLDFFTPPTRPDQRRGLLSAGRLVRYKRHDLAIRLAAKVARPLTVAGSGPELEGLRQLAASVGAEVTFVVQPSDLELRDLYRTSELVLNLGHEDFGMIPVEGMACGTPVLAYGRGGVLDYLKEGSGVLSATQSLDDLAIAYKEFEAKTFRADEVRADALPFGYAPFYASLANAVCAVAAGPVCSGSRAPAPKWAQVRVRLLSWSRQLATRVQNRDRRGLSQ